MGLIEENWKKLQNNSPLFWEVKYACNLLFLFAVRREFGRNNSRRECNIKRYHREMHCVIWPGLICLRVALSLIYGKHNTFCGPWRRKIKFFSIGFRDKKKLNPVYDTSSNLYDIILSYYLFLTSSSLNVTWCQYWCQHHSSERNCG